MSRKEGGRKKTAHPHKISAHAEGREMSQQRERERKRRREGKRRRERTRERERVCVRV